MRLRFRNALNKWQLINLNAYSLALFCVIILSLSGCAGLKSVPDRRDNICEIFRQNREWYLYANNSFRRWGVPIPIMMAIMYYESGFRSDARPPRTTCLYIFPGPRLSSAYGYPQAKDETWDGYRQSTGKFSASRDDFEDSIDFVGWYCFMSVNKCKIVSNDAYNLYLAYHEGQGGYNRKSYQSKDWVMKIASSVKNKSAVYADQLASCEREFLKTGGCWLWPF